METNVLDRYIGLRQEIAALERELELLKPEVMEEVRSRGRVAHLDGFKLHLRTYTTWDYSPEVTSMNTALKAAKQRERQNGTASVRERRDMLVLKSLRPEGFVVHETLDDSYEWESDEAPDAYA